MTKYEKQPDWNPLVKTLRFEKKDYELYADGRVFVKYENGNYQRPGMIGPKTPCRRVLHRDSPRLAAIKAEFELRGVPVDKSQPQA